MLSRAVDPLPHRRRIPMAAIGETPCSKWRRTSSREECLLPVAAMPKCSTHRRTSVRQQGRDGDDASRMMLLTDILQDIYALEDEMRDYERKYGVLLETFYVSHMAGEEPPDVPFV